MKIATIYKATNLINNKVYIGFDSNWYIKKNRKYSHKKHSKNENSNHYNCDNNSLTGKAYKL